MDYGRVYQLRDQVTQAADGLAEHVPAGLLDVLTPPEFAVWAASAFGNTPGAAECHRAWQQVAGAAAAASSRLVQALRADADRLDQVIFTFQTTDAAEADRINAAGNPLTFISSHAHNNSDRFPGEWNDRLRGRQLDRLVDFAARLPGPVVVGSDDNVSLVPREQHDYDAHGPEELGRYRDEGFQDVGDVGPTINDRTIDHVHARGLPAREPTLIDGGPSDHNGQSVTYLLTDW